STTLTVTSAVTATPSSYSIVVTAASAGTPTYSSTAAATYSIGSQLSTAVSTDKPAYSGGETVTNTDTTTMGGKPVVNAAVTFTITKPNGAIVTQSATTDTNGQAIYKLRLNKQKDPKGIYQVRTIATSNGASANASTSFTVQ